MLTAKQQKWATAFFRGRYELTKPPAKAEDGKEEQKNKPPNRGGIPVPLVPAPDLR